LEECLIYINPDRSRILRFRKEQDTITNDMYIKPFETLHNSMQSNTIVKRGEQLEQQSQEMDDRLIVLEYLTDFDKKDDLIKLMENINMVENKWTK